MHTTLLRRNLQELVDNVLPDGVSDPLGMAPHKENSAGCYANNPYREQSKKPSQYLTVTDGVVSGHIGVFPLQVRYQGKNHLAYGGSYYEVDPGYRKYGVGIPLLKTVIDEFSDTLFMVNCVTPMATPVYKFLKMPLTGIPVLGLTMTSGIKLRVMAGGRLAFLAPLANAYLALRRFIRLRKKARLKGFTIKEHKIVPVEVDAIVAADDHPYAEWHGHEYLQWILDNSVYANRANRHFFGVYKGDTMVGFYLTKEELKVETVGKGPYKVRKGVIMERGTIDPEALPEERLCLHALLSFGSRVHFSIINTNDEKLLRFFVGECGFHQQYLSNWGVHGRIGEAPGAPDITDIRNWRIRTALAEGGLI